MNRILITIAIAVSLAGCELVTQEALQTAEDGAQARQMNRAGIFRAYERCDDLITAEYNDLVELAVVADTPHEATFWRQRAAFLIGETKRDLLTVQIIKKIREGDGRFELDCFGDYQAEPYAPPAMS